MNGYQPHVFCKACYNDGNPDRVSIHAVESETVTECPECGSSEIMRSVEGEGYEEP